MNVHLGLEADQRPSSQRYSFLYRTIIAVFILVTIISSILVTLAPGPVFMGLLSLLLCVALLVRRRSVPYVLMLAPILMNGPLQVIVLGESTGTAAVALIMMGLGLLYLFVAPNKDSNRRHGRLLLPLIAYAVFFVINIMWLGNGIGLNNDTRRWIMEIGQPLIAYLLALYVCRRDGLQTLRRWLVALAFFEAATSIVALVGTGQLRELLATAIQNNGQVGRDYQAYALESGNRILALAGGTFGHANLLGTLLALLLPQILASWRGSKWRSIQSYGRLIVVALVFAASLLTFSRAVWLGISVGTLVVGFSAGYKRLVLVSLAGVAIIGGVVLSSEALSERLNDQTTIMQRQDLLQQGIELYSRQPLFGYGLAFFTSDDPLRTSIMNPHNDYLTRLIGGGIIGFLFFIAPFVVMLLVAAQTYLRSNVPRVKFEAAVALAACLSFMILMVFNPIQELFSLLLVSFAMLEAYRSPYRSHG